MKEWKQTDWISGMGQTTLKDTDFPETGISPGEKEDPAETASQRDDISTEEREVRRAEARAMKLLTYHMMTVREMRERLIREGFNDDLTETAIRYCSSFGYLNDARYAENYLYSMRQKKSARMIRGELVDKGVEEAVIDQVFDENPWDESSVIYDLVCRKAGYPHHFDERELRRVYAFLARKGFEASGIWRAIHRFQDEAKDDEI